MNIRANLFALTNFPLIHIFEYRFVICLQSFITFIYLSMLCRVQVSKQKGINQHGNHTKHAMWVTRVKREKENWS